MLSCIVAFAAASGAPSNGCGYIRTYRISTTNASVLDFLEVTAEGKSCVNNNNTIPLKANCDS